MRGRITLLAFLCCACGDAAGPVEDAAHAHSAEGFRGRARLTGELVEADSGCLMVSVYTPGNRMPFLTYRVEMDSPAISREGDERVLDFLLDSTTSMIPGPVPDDIPLELEVRYDRDGRVETKEGDVAARVPAEIGDDGIALILSPDS